MSCCNWNLLKNIQATGSPILITSLSQTPWKLPSYDPNETTSILTPLGAYSFDECQEKRNKLLEKKKKEKVSWSVEPKKRDLLKM